MALTPSFEAFDQGWSQGKNQLVYTRLAADLDTPVSVMMKLADAGRDSFILIRDRGRGARALLDHRHEARPDLGMPGRR